MIHLVTGELGCALHSGGSGAGHLDDEDTAERTIHVVVGYLHQAEVIDAVDGSGAGGA